MLSYQFKKIKFIVHSRLYVKYKNVKSDLLLIKTSMPQGLILESLFCSILTNDLIHSSRKFSFRCIHACMTI